MYKFSQKKQKKQSGSFQDFSSPDSHNVTKQADIDNVEEWEKQIWFWRSHIDIFIEEYFSSSENTITLFPFQKVIARQCAECNIVDDVESRSLGKTFKMALILIAFAVLYSNNKILIVSKTARQALLTIRYIEMLATDYPNIAREIKFPISVQKDVGHVNFRSGSNIEALAMSLDGSNIRGLRKKIIYIDESVWVNTDVIQSVLMPILQYKRSVYWKYKDIGFEDFNSKLFQTTSAYLKSCDYFQRFKNNLKDIKNGDVTKFACALNYKTGVRYGIIDEDFVDIQKSQMPLSSWEMEWNARFIGSTEGSYFPYAITEPCRTLEHIEFKQARHSKSRYLLICDIATSEASYADNSCICILKISEKLDGTFIKYLVFIKSYHGKKLEVLASEIRVMCARFPNIEKVIIDVNALGEGIVSLLNTPFIDENNKEYPPFVLDSYEKVSGIALPIIRGVRADNKFNNRMAIATKMFLENKSLHLPLTSNTLRREMEIRKKEKSKNTDEPTKHNLVMEEMAIFIETDALQFEMGNIVPKLTVSGNVTYDAVSGKLHKDRYTALAMGLEYVYELEEINKANRNDSSELCLGEAYSW